VNSIITFYSFKGGVGRSMALANIGYLLTTQMGKRVLCVDWDLEAPGLEKYFAGCPGATIEASGKGGLIDLLTCARSGSKPDWHDYVSTVHVGDHAIGLISSGQRNGEYPARVLGFDWQMFFEQSEGGAFVEWLRDEWHREFDLTLIDSRTGFTDSGGVCTVQMPDILVPVFTTTDQSARGAIDVVERAQRARQKLAYDRSRLLVFPLPSRYDGRTQYNEAKEWLHRFAEWFAPYYADWLPPGVAPLQVIERTKLPYIGYFSFGAQMPAAIEGTSDPESLGFAYNVAATIIATDFQQVEGLIAAVPAAPNQPSRTELAWFRMRRALLERKSEWRYVDTLAAAAGIGVTEALDVLRGDSEVDFGRGKSGRIIVRVRDSDQNSAISEEKFMAQRADARVRFIRVNPVKWSRCTGYFESSFYPAHFERHRFDLEALRAATKRGNVTTDGLPFLFSDPDHTYVIEDGYETLVHPREFGFRVGDYVNFWRFHQSGFLYHRTAMRPASEMMSDEESCLLDFRVAAIRIAESVKSLTLIYDGLLGGDDEVAFVLTLLGTENRMLSSTPMPLRAAYICRIPEITVKRQMPVFNWRENLTDHAVEMAKEIYLRFNWATPNLQDARAAIDNALN
jgi:hypothetical protein